MSFFGKQCVDIRKTCLNFLIDMLNDEIDSVRIAALYGIQSFNEVLTLNDYEVDTVLFSLSEDNSKLREAIYQFFKEITVNQAPLFQKILDKIFINLGRFKQQDRDKIFSLVQRLGKTHSKIVQGIYYKILGIDKRFLAKEPDWNDLVYIAKMILMYSAAEIQPSMLIECPNFFGKHVNYLRD
eukprot:CAMPEP_0116871834 /NCGR_PEP_ID=MMETSP0463-20121206/2352_1 /TAXON_ID=181622 /ORGANISM="Strombidinopsis sp, Strain SopsisLIS2011" /LENGTH=182 /DNA_ID=CAMNT_0004510987 /DNA_START=512 /DNA_END=1060 /DNA_ORIENTATION=-